MADRDDEEDYEEDDETSVETRSEWAEHALNAHTKVREGAPLARDLDSMDALIIDLITDLLHLARQEGFKPERLVETALGHYELEKE